MSEEEKPPTTGENKFMIMGYNVEFPHGKKPFPAQFAVMNKVLTALKTKQHALLESPTGSGKTLALLCSSLTFQKQVYREELAAAKREQTSVKFREQEAKKRIQEAQLWALEAQMQVMAARQQIEQARKQRKESDDDGTQLTVELTNVTATQATLKDGEEEEDDDDEMDTQVTLKKEDDEDDEDVVATQPSRDEGWLSTRKREPNADYNSITKRKRVLPESFAAIAEAAAETQEELDDGAGNSTLKRKRVVPPRIYFCSRTHSQLAQVVAELKSCPVSYLDMPGDSETPMKQLKTCVLGSKRQMCINCKVNQDPAQVDEKCRLALEGASCSYFKKRKKVNELRRRVSPVWDIEDLVKLAQKHRECAYFHSREALENANIVFAPYNYLLDPSIREAVGIILHRSIIVLDEAHNVEDTCRSSASMEVTAEGLTTSIKAFSIVIKHGNRPKPYNALLKLLNGISRWLKNVDANANAILQPSGAGEKSKVWDGDDALAMLEEYSGVTKSSINALILDMREVREYESVLANSTESSREPQTEVAQDAAANPTGASVLLGALALATVQSILTVVDYMYRDSLKYIDDFKLVVIKSKSTWQEDTGSRFPTKRNVDEWEIKLCIWCLNAAVAFSDITRQARSVILTSGTLSPMGSFVGELGVDFPIRLEANHVVNMRKQVFVGAVMHGPGNVDLQSTYDNQQNPRYQDSMGHLLLQYSQAIPGGILMFFPSYSLLNKLVSRWKKTKLWGEIEQFKTIFSEPRNAGKGFDSLLEDYKNTITQFSEAAAAGPDGKEALTKSTGAIFLAVYRGKVSEGIDFSNDNARAVLCVGIPFPSLKELQVSMKRKYQDEKSRMDVDLVNGHVWYQLQAFRALNQALGRCIRHRQDYGAIMLLDSRHRFNKHVNLLSKWMRPYIQEFEHSQMCVPMFSDFFQRNFVELPYAVSPSSVEVSKMSEMEAGRAPLVLEYETDKSGKKNSTTARSQISSHPLSSTMATVNELMTKQKHESDAKNSVFSIFQSRVPGKLK
uniref:Helicase ATP-binding domain-containing protein n=1 Tax=Peronospora matthiolae TaxID=2874970 RepID=A0AAV1VND3_9STRA